MKTILFLLLTVSVSAQSLTTVPRVIYKATKADSVVCSFRPLNHEAALLTVKADNEIIDNNVSLTGLRELTFVLDSGATVVASATGAIGYVIYRNGINVTPAPVADNSLAEFIVWYNNRTAAEQRKLTAYALWKMGLKFKEIKQAIK